MPKHTKVWLLILALAASPRLVAQERVLFGPGRNDLGPIKTADATCTQTDKVIQVQTGHREPWPGITIPPREGQWDLSTFAHLAVEVRNTDNRSVTVHCRVDNPGADGREHCLTDTATVGPGQTGSVTVRFCPTPWVLSEPLSLIGMRGYPQHQDKLDPSNVVSLVVFVNRPDRDSSFEITRIAAGGSVTRLDAKTFTPFIDEYGQFIHANWPGKIQGAEDLARRQNAEAQDLTTHPGPEHWNQYGGWNRGPKLEPTGRFRVHKHEGKWWLVDPEGRLFWSHGIDCVRDGNSTPISHRESYWNWLPDEGSAFAAFYGEGAWAPHGYYRDHSPYRTFDFGRANLLRKYGRNWRGKFAAIAHRRLRSWGLNTIGNWSQTDICLLRRTPYVGTISFESRRLEGSTGYWGKFFDVFDSSFREAMRKSLEAQVGKGLNDPWCIGYFVHNELAWGDEVSLALATLKSPADQPAKTVFIGDLQTKYGTIDQLNHRWGTTYGSWDNLRNSTNEPDRGRAWEDLTAFYTKTAQTYFSIIRDEFKRAAPDQLYLGCRFAWVNERAARAAARYCDVIGYNLYTYSVADFRLPNDIDLPVIVGEFHFGALDRGMFHPGLKPTADQNDRAAKYRDYVEGALRNPYIVGTHWFQYQDQATTGRGDGENYQIGFIDICDTPYPETIAACRQVAARLYRTRLGR